MRTHVEYRTTHVPAFLTKLWKLVTDSSSDDLISWSVGGTSFIIYDEIRFAKELLPMYFKHNNMASFVRQLNMYGFRKLSCVDQGAMHSTKHEIEFYHHYFIKHQESLLELIKRKIPSNRSTEEARIKPEYVKDLISNIKYLQGQQHNSEEGLKNLRKENKLLWRQLTLLNGRYMKQQAMLQQVLPVFVNMIQPGHRLPPIKRRTPLMIHESENESKMQCIETSYSIENPDSELSSDYTPSPGNVSNRGPVIHDITEMESSSNGIFAESVLCSPNAAKENEVIVDSPLSSLGSAEHTMDTTFTESSTLATSTSSMEPLNVLNCDFQSTSAAATEEEMLPQSSMQIPILGSEPCNISLLQQTPAVNMNVGSTFIPTTVASLSSMNEDANHSSDSASNSAVMSQIQAIDNILSWMPTSAIPANEQNLDNWLGQVFKADNLIAGASLP